MSPLENAWNDVSPDGNRNVVGEPRPPLIKTTQPTELSATELRAMRNFDYLTAQESTPGVFVGSAPDCNEVFHHNLGAKEIEGDDWKHQVGQSRQSEQRNPVTGADEASDARDSHETARKTKSEQVLLLADADGNVIPSASAVKKTGVQVMWYDCTVSPAVFTMIEVDIV